VKRGAAVKKVVFTILIVSLAIGLPFMVLDFLYKGAKEFRVPEELEKLVVDLGTGERDGELLLERYLPVPSTVELFFQSNTEGPKHLRLKSEGEMLGRTTPEVGFVVGRYTGTQSASASLVLAPGRYALYLTSGKEEGQLIVGYREIPIDQAEFARLSKIHGGDLNNPPSGYKDVYSAHLAGLDAHDEAIYTISTEKALDLGLSIYTSAQQGTVSVDFVGSTFRFLGLVSTEHRMCDQLELTLPRGEYQVKLSCQEADGQLYVFLKEGP